MHIAEFGEDFGKKSQDENKCRPWFRLLSRSGNDNQVQDQLQFSTHQGQIEGQFETKFGAPIDADLCNYNK